jgi:hypothetical protein
MSLPRRSTSLARIASIAMLALLLPAAALHAQLEERPVPFDSAQRMTAITPFLAGRLKLQAPAWPVGGTFREARLYSAGDGGVLVVQREDGTLVRYPLDAAGMDALRAAVENGMRESGNPAGEPDAYRYTEMAGSRFARRQLILGPLLYGPFMASLSNNGEDAMTLYLLGSGLPALVSLGVAGESVTRAQADLAMDASPRFALLSSFAYRAAGGERGSKSHSIAVLAGALGASAGGLYVGRHLTDGEARGMIWGSNYALALTAGSMAASGAFKRTCVTSYADPYYYDRRCSGGTSRGEFAGMTAAALIGYPLGLQYVRQTDYGVTAGDLRAQSVASTIGAVLGAAVVGDGASSRDRWTGATGGLFLGMLAGDRLLVKPYDYTRGQASLLVTGAAAGGLIGLAVTSGAESDDASVYLASSGLGAAVGAAMAHQMMRPRHASQRGVLRDASRRVPSDRGLAVGAAVGSGAPRRTAVATEPRVQWQVDPAGLAMAAARAPGRHGILSITF